MDILNSRNTLLVERAAESADESWLWSLYSELLGPSIDKQWGWDEGFQRKNFEEHLPYSQFSIVQQNTLPVAAYVATANEAVIYLHVLLVDTEYQLQDIGTHVLDLLKARAQQNNYVIELSVVRANKVVGFYEKNGFNVVESTDDKQICRWTPK